MALWKFSGGLCAVAGTSRFILIGVSIGQRRGRRRKGGYGARTKRDDAGFLQQVLGGLTACGTTAAMSAALRETPRMFDVDTAVDTAVRDRCAQRPTGGTQ